MNNLITSIAKRKCTFCSQSDYIFILSDSSLVVVRTGARIIDKGGESFEYLNCSWCGRKVELRYNCYSMNWARFPGGYVTEKEGRWYETRS